jgi:hypothetical protein
VTSEKHVMLLTATTHPWVEGTLAETF